MITPYRNVTQLNTDGHRIQFLTVTELGQNMVDTANLQIDGEIIKNWLGVKSRFGTNTLLAENVVYLPMYSRFSWGISGHKHFKLCSIELTTKELSVLGRAHDLVMPYKIEGHKLYAYTDVNNVSEYVIDVRR